MEGGEELKDCVTCSKPASLRFGKSFNICLNVAILQPISPSYFTRCSGCRGVVYCDVDCQKVDRARHKADCKCWEVVGVEGRGKGLGARMDLPMGHLILR